MAGRGRGWPANKGLGRGMLMEQLGLQKGEVVSSKIQAPPSTYPPLQFRPNQTNEERDLAQSYRLVVKKEFREHMQNSEYYILLDAKKSDIERYSDRYQLLANRKSKLNLYWPRFPKELHSHSSKTPTKSNRKKIPIAPNLKRSKTKDVNVKEKLEELEKKESSQDNKEEEDEEPVEVVEEVEEEDEEMDEGTDYVNSYFDNGEDYIEEDDDGLEEGGVFS